MSGTFAWKSKCPEVRTAESIVVGMVSSHDRYGGSGELKNMRKIQEM
jgi:hypothetical protein